MSTQPFNQQAASLVEETVGLIKQVLIKHSAAVLEEMYEQIMSRNARISALEKNAKANEELYNAMSRELETVRTIAHRAEERAKQAASERDALLADKDEYCEVLRVLGMEEEGSAVEEVLRLVKAENDLRYEHEHPLGLASLLKKACAERDKYRDEADELDRRIGRIIKEGL